MKGRSSEHSLANFTKLRKLNKVCNELLPVYQFLYKMVSGLNKMIPGVDYCGKTDKI